MVLEEQDDPDLSIGGVKRLRLRASESVDKQGNPDGTGTGMGWFPGYAINVETGERLNMAFGEDSWLVNENGADMMWNPTSNITEGFGSTNTRWGGKHYIYVFRSDQQGEQRGVPAIDRDQHQCECKGERHQLPPYRAYDEGKVLYEIFSRYEDNFTRGCQRYMEILLYMGRHAPYWRRA